MLSEISQIPYDLYYIWNKKIHIYLFMYENHLKIIANRSIVARGGKQSDERNGDFKKKFSLSKLNKILEKTQEQAWREEGREWAKKADLMQVTVHVEKW